MDIALIVINSHNKEIEYSGAKNPIFLIREGILTEMRANRMAIGVDERQHLPFSAERFNYKPEDVIYMFSDGYVDQFDRDDVMRFNKRRFKELLKSISAEPLQEQCRIIGEKLEDWRGETKQTDDILVVGIKFFN